MRANVLLAIILLHAALAFAACASNSFVVSSQLGPIFSAFPNGTCSCGSYSGSGKLLTELDANAAVIALQSQIAVLQTQLAAVKRYTVLVQTIYICNFPNCGSAAYIRFATTGNNIPVTTSGPTPTAKLIQVWYNYGSGTAAAIETAFDNFGVTPGSNNLSFTVTGVARAAVQAQFSLSVYLLWEY